MGERTRYEPGTFSWVELGTTDLEGATSFYSDLFGWSHQDLPAGDDMTYRMFFLNGKSVAACYQQREKGRAELALVRDG